MYDSQRYFPVDILRGALGCGRSAQRFQEKGLWSPYLWGLQHMTRAVRPQTVITVEQQGPGRLRTGDTGVGGDYPHFSWKLVDRPIGMGLSTSLG